MYKLLQLKDYSISSPKCNTFKWPTVFGSTCFVYFWLSNFTGLLGCISVLKILSYALRKRQTSDTVVSCHGKLVIWSEGHFCALTWSASCVKNSRQKRLPSAQYDSDLMRVLFSSAAERVEIEFIGRYADLTTSIIKSATTASWNKSNHRLQLVEATSRRGRRTQLFADSGPQQ